MSLTFDVVIIGAGIHGAGAAQAAAAAGYSVLVLEQFDEVAQGASSRSSKLIHGGLRYLETGEFKLVHECLRERAILLRIAPHLVELVPFYIPVYKQTSRRPWKIALGLSIYSFFSRKRFHRIPRKIWHQLDGLRTQDLDAVFSYYDAKTNDARLTRSVLESARSLGAEIITGATLEQAQITSEGVDVSYIKNNETVIVKAGVLVNATGAWVNRVLSRINDGDGEPLQAANIDLVQGTHIVVSGDIDHPYYLEAPQDGRAVFVTPWKNQVMIGTTETVYTGNPAKVCPLSKEINYLLYIYNHYFDKNLVHEDIIHSFAGLRVLPGGEGATFTRSRDTHFHEDDETQPRVISIVGGKLTSYRSTAEKLVRHIRKTLNAKQPIADTRTLELPVVD